MKKMNRKKAEELSKRLLYTAEFILSKELTDEFLKYMRGRLNG